ncbi:MAG: TRAP transporter small permease [Kiloniellaceae bacterium]
MMLHVSADVLFKYLLNRPIVGTLEMVSQYYMVAVVFLPLAATEFRREHILVELFTVRFGARAVAALDSFSCLLAAVFAACVTWMSGIEAVRRTMTFEMVDAVYYQIYVWPTRWFLTVGFGLFTLVLILHSFQFLRRALRKGPTPEATGSGVATP